ncbi:MAG: hypothetical protein QOJ57_1954, partial [Thermoleophilaceae bacterium]|nr:hypothetical protein [Thermoleophilaceae bacterium]
MSRVAVVTGGSSGMGAACVQRYLAEGFAVASLDLAPAAVEGVLAIRLDVTDAGGLAAAAERVGAELGAPSVLVNAAGVYPPTTLETATVELYRRVFDTNVLGTVAVTRAVVPHMRAAGCGRIVTVTSVGGRVPGFGVSIYCASKFAQEGLAEGLALELAPFGIQSIIVEPGMIRTSRWAEHRGTAKAAGDVASPYYGLFWASEAIADAIVERSPTTPADVAAAVASALTDEQPRLRYVVGRG